MCIKGHYQQSEKVTDKMGENICKLVSDEALISSIYKELQKHKQPDSEMGKGLE